MNEKERTPSPSVVDVGPPPALDSKSGTPVTVEAVREHRVQRSRTGITRAFILGGILVAATVGSDAKKAVTDYQRDQVRAGIAKAEKTPQSIKLQQAQVTASAKLFGSKGGSANTDAAQEVANYPGDHETLDVKGYLPENDQVQISEDGKTFTTEGQNYSINQIVSEDGSVYVVASKSVVEERLFSKDRIHAVSPLLVGGAHNDASSDLNKDGVVTAEEVRETADEDARYNLRKVFAPRKKFLIEGNKITEVSQK